MNDNFVSLSACRKKYNIRENLIEYLNIPIVKINNVLNISKDDFDKMLEFKNTHDTKTILQKYTFMKRYGVDNPQKVKEIKDKSKSTMLERYGVENISQSEEIKLKKRKTTFVNYGVDNPSKNKDVLNKMFETKLKRYGDKTYGFNSDSYKKSMLEKYGVDNAMQNNEIKNKSLNTRLENKKQELKQFENLYSVSELCQMFERCYDTMLDILKIKNVNIITIKDSYYVDKSEFSKIKNYISSAESKRTSMIETELYEYIKSIYNGDIIRNCRNIINPLELDIYIPSKNVAIEFDGVYYHNNKFKDKNYHYNKTNACIEKGIRLIHVFEDDWIFNKDICKSMIASSIGVYQEKIFARKCIVKELSVVEYKNFINKNHLQGFAKATHYVGLIYKNELVQCVGINKNGINKCWELNRMVTKLNTQIIGGFSKLVNYSVKTFNIDEMNSYVFRAWFDGKGYEKVGFKFDYECPPTYWYIVNDRKVNRMNYQKNKIKRKVEIGELKYFNENETEFENMSKNGINWIWDSGKIRLKYKV